MALRSIFSLFITLTLSCCLQTTAWGQDSEKNQDNVVESAKEPSTHEGEAAATPTDTTKTPEAEPATTTNAAPTESPSEKTAPKEVAWPNFEKAFEAGVQNYRDKKYNEAREAFAAAVTKDPENVQAITNLALVQFQLGQKAEAVAWLRKAHDLDPNFSTPKSALQFILPQLDVKEIPHEIQFWETFRTHVIVPFSLNLFLLITGLSFLLSGWLLLTYLGRRREALKEEKPLPAFPMFATFLSVLFLSLFVLTMLKFWDLSIPRGTIVTQKVSVYSAPNEKSVSLFDLYGGLEVILKEQQDQWVQVTYPGASTGWVLKSSVLQSSGSQMW